MEQIGAQQDAKDEGENQISPATKSPPSLETTLHALPRLIQQRQEELDRREEELRKAEEAFSRETGKAYGDTKPNDVLHLNVGGTRCDTLRRTLCQIEGSMLASRFSGRWDETIERDRDGNFFIDQPYELFGPFLDFLRAGQNSTPGAPPVRAPPFDDEHALADFYRMVEYYGCTPGVYPTSIALHRGVPGGARFSPHPNLAVETDEWSTFALRTEGHSRDVVAYEIELGRVERALVGWIRPNQFGTMIGEGDWRGVGEEGYSVALDCCRSFLLSDGNAHPIKSLGACGGAVIRCERESKRWIVNDKVVVSPDTHATANCNALRGMPDKTFIPAFSGKGEFRIRMINLSN